MTLDHSQRNLMSRALVLAADRYINFAADACSMPGGVRLQQQFLRQAADTRYMAILVGDADSLEMRIGFAADAKQEAAKITTQQFADTLAERSRLEVAHA